MRVVRAILGRFARFLVRIARTRDPALATAPHWVVPERMAALRQRYPGAPEHWLEFVARRTAVGNPAETHAPPPEPRAPADSQPLEASAQSRDTRRNFLRFRERPALAFPQSGARRTTRPNALHIASAPAAAPRPGLTFSANSVRNPIANLLRTGARGPRGVTIAFHADARARRDVEEAGARDLSGSRDHPTFFPEPGPRPAHHPDAVGVDDGQRNTPAVTADMRWPAWPDRSSVDIRSPRELPRASRPDPNFRASDPRWPELPRLDVEYGPSAGPSLDEAILFAEQIGGAWSG